MSKASNRRSEPDVIPPVIYVSYGGDVIKYVWMLYQYVAVTKP